VTPPGYYKSPVNQRQTENLTHIDSTSARRSLAPLLTRAQQDDRQMLSGGVGSMVGIDLAAGGTVFTTTVEGNLPNHKTEVPVGRSTERIKSPSALICPSGAVHWVCCQLHSQVWRWHTSTVQRNHRWGASTRNIAHEMSIVHTNNTSAHSVSSAHQQHVNNKSANYP